MQYVIKRDGKKQLFDKKRIYRAIMSAMKQVDHENELLAQLIANKISSVDQDMDIEDIQNMIEEELMASNFKDAAKAYIIYRDDKTKAREELKQFTSAISEKLMASNIQNQNANVDECSFGGRRGEACSELMRKFTLDHLLSEKSKQRHLNNEVYIHDLDSYAVGMHNCLSVPMDDLLANGFCVRQTDVRPAQSISTAFQLVAVLFQVQSLQQFGGVSATHLDWTMVPYVRKSFFKHYRDGVEFLEERQLDYSFHDSLSIEDEDYKLYSPKAYQYAVKMTGRELKQSVEGMYHNLNTLQSRSGNQLPFSSINYGTCTLPEGRMVIKALLDGSINGVGKLHRTPVYPCGIFQCAKGINRSPEDPNYDLFKLALKSTSLRLYPNYVNVDWSGNAGYDKNDPRTYMSTMGCRTANGYDINGLGQLKDGRGNICPVTVILPTLAMQAKQQQTSDVDVLDVFFSILETAIDDAKDMLIERYEYICSQPASSAKFMYENGSMAGYVPQEGIRSALKHGTLALGQLGLAETLQILIGCNHTEESGMQLAKQIEQLFKDKCAQFKQQYHLNFGVYYSPAETLCYTAMKKFKEKYGLIPNVSDREYFTNSMHIPVWEKLTPFQKIKLESELTGYSSAGCITYIELESSVKNNLSALESYVNYAMDLDIPYFAINVPNDTCLDCGYTDEFNDSCPVCGSKNIQQLRRVTGYLTSDYKTAFNLGKQAEVKDRVKHDKILKEVKDDYISKYRGD